MNIKLILAIGLLGVGVVLLAFNWRSHSPEHYLANHQWPARCVECGAEATLTSKEMNAMIKRGEALTSPTEPRRFKCTRCGKIALTMRHVVLNPNHPANANTQTTQ